MNSWVFGPNLGNFNYKLWILRLFTSSGFDLVFSGIFGLLRFDLVSACTGWDG